MCVIWTTGAAEVTPRTMNHSAGCSSNPRRTVSVLQPFSTRTLQHPSFMPLYRASGFTENFRGCHCQPVHPIIPAEFFYSDPTMGPGRRVQNLVTELRVFDCFQLDTPPPIMSTSVAPPILPDPFRSGFHPTRILGSAADPGWDPRPSQIVVQLSEEEDQAITNLLKLHHEEPRQEPADSEKSDHGLRSQIQQERQWSDTEMEAAETLLSRFSPKEKDTAKPDHVPVEHDVDSSDMQDLDSSLAAGMVEMNLKHSDLRDLSLLEERKVSEVEKHAVFALLSLGGTGS